VKKEKMAWQKWLVVLGGVLAVLGQFVGSYLPLVGGALSIIFGLMTK
jgi:hypothetical protein